MLFNGANGEVITTYNNDLVKQDDVPDHAASTRLSNHTAHINEHLGSQAQTFEFKKWMWVDHALLSVGWGEAQAARADIKPGLQGGNHQIILGTPLQLALLQRQSSL